jgi:hypothetical protein
MIYHRPTDPYALPDLEVFYSDVGPPEADPRKRRTGWYWHLRFGGCLPTGRPIGPFASEAEAIANGGNAWAGVPGERSDLVFSWNGVDARS